jgi:seryl-tRNA synthetase
MATLKQLIKLQEQVKTAQVKLDEYKKKRSEMIKSLGLVIPSFGRPRSETFVSLDDKPVRLWVDAWGDLEIEYLKF